MTEKKVTKLKGKDPKAAEPSKPKILIFGKPGVGKTWTSLDFPKVYYIDTEGGADLNHYTDKLKKSGGLYMGPEDGTRDSNIIIEQLQALATEEHGFKTVIIDSLSKVYADLIAKEAEKLGDKDAFGASKKPAIAWTRKLMSWVNRIEMNVVLICHEKDLWKNGKSEDVTFDAFEKLEYDLHLVLQILKRGAVRVALPRKSRLLGFPEGESFTWSYEDFALRYGKDIIEKEAKPIILATKDQLDKLNLLLENVKISEEEIEKWWSKAQVTGWAEMSMETMEKVINFLTTKVTGEK